MFEEVQTLTHEIEAAVKESGSQVEQRSDEWHQQRLGKVTASRIADLMATTRSGYSTSCGTYMTQLILERLTGEPQSSFSNATMQWGIDTEPLARIAYEFYSGADVVETGFHIHPTFGQAGASPDGLIGDDGLLEIKCPNSNTHLETLLSKGKIAHKYMLQMQWQMACTGREWCDFVSFDPRFPEHLTLVVTRVPRDNALIAEIENEVMKFLHELDAKLEALKQMGAA